MERQETWAGVKHRQHDNRPGSLNPHIRCQFRLMNKPALRSPSQDGFSLVELMVAVLLGTILSAGVVSVYLASEKDYGLNNALSEVQKSGRSALSLLEPRIRMAGFLGCRDDVQPQSILKTDLTTYSLNAPAQGYEYVGTGMGATYAMGTDPPNAAAWSPSLPPDIRQAIGTDSTAAGAAVAGSDILLLHEAVPSGVTLANPSTDDPDGVFVETGQGTRLSIGELAIVSDCAHTNLFQITDVAENYQGGPRDRIAHSPDANLDPGNAVPGRFINDGHSADAQLLLYQIHLFYIGLRRDRNTALYEVSLQNDGTLGKPMELVSGVESMQLLYGVDTDDDGIPNRFLTADEIADWKQVVNVRIALLTRGGQNSADAGGTSSYKLLDQSRGVTLAVPADGRIRRVFEETISIRNRLP
ncbi:MAG: PilW family protein [Bacillota bacterium]